MTGHSSGIVADMVAEMAAAPGNGGTQVRDAEDLLLTEDKSYDFRSDRHFAATVLLSGKAVDPHDFPCSVDGLTGYLRALGCPHFSGPEIADPPKRWAELARRVLRERGGSLLLARWAWPRTGSIVCPLERCRVLIREPIDVAWHWRPAELNASVGGAAGSDHVEATAIDVDFRSARGMSVSLARVLEPMYRSGLLRLSMGIGRRRLHLGVLSSRGQRRWSYASRGA